MRILMFSIPAAIVIALDRLTKAAIKANLEIFQDIEVIPGFFYITHIENRGMAFGIKWISGIPGMGRWLLVAVTLAAILAISFYWYRYRKDSVLYNLACGLIFGGAIGNFIDRAATGRVTDFLQFGYKGFIFPVFNIADTSVTIGVALFIIYILNTNETGAGGSDKPAAYTPGENARLKEDGKKQHDGETRNSESKNS